MFWDWIMLENSHFISITQFVEIYMVYNTTVLADSSQYYY